MPVMKSAEDWRNQVTLKIRFWILKLEDHLSIFKWCHDSHLGLVREESHKEMATWSWNLAHHFGGDQGCEYFAENNSPRRPILKACKSFSYRSASSNLSKSSLKECQESDPPRIYGLPRRLTLYSQKPRLLRLPRSNFPHAKAPPAKRDKRLWGWEWKLAGRESTLREDVVCWKYSSSRIF